MKNQIEKLTPEQEAQFPKYTKKYTSIGLDTSPIDFDNAVEIIKNWQGSENIGYRKFVYCESPMGVPKDAVNMTYGQHDSNWVSHYAFFQDNFGICPEIEEMKTIIENLGWVFFDSENIYVVDRPETIKMDEQNRAHCGSGPAIRYRDGFAVYIWHGLRVPESWIMNPESLSEKEFLYHKNAEMRRVACEIVGWNTVLNKLNAQIVDEDNDPEIGTLVEVNIPEIGKERFLKVLCGTKREFAMPVPKEMKTAIQAQAWMLGFDDVNEFMPPEVRT